VIGAKSVKDTRPLGDKSFQQKTVRSILDFLREQGFHNDALTSKHFPLSSKDFTEIFNFIYSFLNPDVGEVLPYTRSEEKIINILKNELKYPGQITKSNLVTMGSLHSWPTVLGCLHFMTDKAKTFNRIKDSLEMIAFPSLDDQGFPDGNESEGKLRIEHIASCYAKFNEGHNEYPEEMDLYRARLHHRYGIEEEHMRQLQEEYLRQKKRNEEFSTQIKAQKQRIHDSKAQLSRMEEDRVKLTEYVQSISRKSKAYMKEVEQLQGQNTDLDTQEKEKEEVLKSINQKKAASGLAVSGMNAQLEVEKRRRIQQTEDQIKVLQDERWQLEIQFYKVVESLEKVSRDFNSGCIQLQLKNGEEFTTLPLPVFNGGVVSREASIPELRDTLADLLRDMKARSKAQIQELIRLKADLSAGADNLKAAMQIRTQHQNSVVELETVLVDLKERVAREETGLDKQLTDLKSQLGQLRSQKQVSQEEHDHEIEAKREKLQELTEFNRTRKADGTEFLNKAFQRALKHMEDNQARLRKARKKVKGWTAAKREASKKALEELEAIEAEINQMVSNALED